MSDELKIELQVETDDSRARSQLDNLIDEFNSKKPINLKINLGDKNLEAFQTSIKGMTSDLDTLSKLNFSNLKTIETSLKNITKIVGEYKGLTSDNKNNIFKSSTGGTGLDGLDSININRLSSDHNEALAQIETLKADAKRLREGFTEYGKHLKGAYEVLQAEIDAYNYDINSLENEFDTTAYKKLFKYTKEFNEVVREYNSLGVDVVEKEAFRNYDVHAEKYHTSKWRAYEDLIGQDADKYQEAVERARVLNDKKRDLTKKLKNFMEQATEEEKQAIEYMNFLYENMPSIPDTEEADNIKNGLLDVFKNDTFLFEFKNLNMDIEEDFKKACDIYFKSIGEIQEEYSRRFKNEDGFKGSKIFDVDDLKEQNEKLDKEIDSTINITERLKKLGTGALDTLGINADSLNAFEIVAKSAQELETKLTSLKEKLANTFEISDGSLKSLDKIKEALIEINKLTDEQKQTFFDLGLDTENIKKSKEEVKELEETTERINDISFSGLMESYSRLESATGKVLSETEKLRTSAMSTVTLSYRYEEDQETGELTKELSTARYVEEISKRTKQLVKEYSNASKDLAKAQREYYQALTDGKSSENTIDKLTKDVNEMEANLKKIRSNIDGLDGYSEVLDELYKEFNKIDELRHSQMENDSLKVIDKADLVEANTLLKQSKTIIDQMSKSSIDLQKAINAGYETTVEGLEARIESKQHQLTSNLTKLIHIPNSKAAVDQIFAYQLDKAQQTEIEIAKIKDKANKNTGTKIVDEQDQYLKKYKETLVQIKAITKSLAKENTDSMSTEKVLQLDKAYKQLKEIQAKLNDVKKEAAEGFYDKAMSELDLSLANSFSKTVRELDKVEEKITKLGRSDYADSNLVGSAERIIKGLRETLDKGLGSINAEGISKVLVEIEQLKKAAKDIDLDIKLSKDSEKIEAFTKGITEQLEVLQSTAKNVDVSHITKQLRELTAGSDKNSVVMKSITDDVKNLERRLKSAGDVASATGINFRGFFDDLGSSLSTFTLGEVLGDIITDALYQTVDVIKEMDAAMSNLKKVADISDINTSDKLDSIRGQAIDIAKEVGMASSDVINAIADTLQAGIGSMEESIQVARSAMILANVGDMTQEAASKSLNTIINGYNLKPLKEIDVQVGGLTQRTTELANAMDLLNYAG